MIKKWSATTIILFLLLSTLLPPAMAQTIQSDGLPQKEQCNSTLYADTGGPYQGKTHIPLTFDGTGSYDSESSIVTFHWFCGDGALETGEITSHTYKYPGTYTLILTIINQQGHCNTQTTTVTINEDDAPTLTFLSPLAESFYLQDTYFFPIQQKTICIGPITITVDAFDDVAIQKVEFSIDNTLMHTCYNEPYSYTLNTHYLTHSIKAIAYDSSGHTATISQEIFKWNIHPILIFLLLLRSIQQQEPLFTSFSQKETHGFSLLNMLNTVLNNDPSANSALLYFIASLLDRNENDASSQILQFLQNHPLIKNRFIKQYPIIYFLLLIDANLIESRNTPLQNHPFFYLIGSIYLISQIKNSESNIPKLFDNNIFRKETSFLEWAKNHPSFIIGTSLLLAFLLLRSTTAPVETVDNSDDENRIPHANTGGPYQGNIYAPIVFSAEKSYDEDGTITFFEWDFGDGQAGSGKIVEHQYDTPGIFLVRLTVKDTENAEDTDTIQVTITDEKPASLSTGGQEDFTMIIIISAAFSTLIIAGAAMYKFKIGFFK